MYINLNNVTEEIEGEKITINDLIKYKNFTFKLLVTKINGQLINKQDRDKAYIHDGDDIIILHMISGG